MFKTIMKKNFFRKKIMPSVSPRQNSHVVEKREVMTTEM